MFIITTSYSIQLFFEKYSGEWTASSIETQLKAVIEGEVLGVGNTLWPMRVALSGEQNSPGPFEIAAVLEKEKVLERLKTAASIL